MNTPAVSTDLSGLVSDEPDWESKSYSGLMDNDGSLELMIPEGDSDEQDQRSVTKMIPGDSKQGRAIPFSKQWSYSMHRIPTREATRLTLKAKAKFQQDIARRGYNSLDCKRKCGKSSLSFHFVSGDAAIPRAEAARLLRKCRGPRCHFWPPR